MKILVIIIEYQRVMHMNYEYLIKEYRLYKDFNPELAEQYLIKMEEYEKLHPEYTGRHLYYRAQFYYHQVDLRRCMEYAIQGVHVLMEREYTPELTKCYNIIGVLNSANATNTMQALDYYLEALELAEQHDDVKTASGLYNNIGCIYDQLEDQTQAIYYFEKALNTSQDCNTELYMTEIVNLALMYTALKDWEHAYEYYEEACKCDDTEVLKTNEIHLAILRTLIAYHKQDIHSVKEYLHMIIEKANTGDVYINGFQELLKQLPKLMDVQLEEELRVLITIIQEMTNKLDLLEAKIRITEISIEFYRMVKDEAKMVELMEQYYEWMKLNKIEQRKVQMDGITLKLQMQQMIKEHEQMRRDSLNYKKQAMHDPLTNLYNRSIIKTTLEPLFQKAKMEGKMIAVSIADVNEFKPFNDHYGHVAGDECIKEIAQVLDRLSDEHRFSLRYGGDEFMGFFYDISPSELKSMIQLVISEVKALHIKHELSSTMEQILTVTHGTYIAIPKEDELLYDFIARADEELYIGKREHTLCNIKYDER